MRAVTPPTGQDGLAFAVRSGHPVAEAVLQDDPGRHQALCGVWRELLG